MHFTSRIRTERLELVPATEELLTADRNDREALARLLRAAVPADWPPPLIDRETLDEFIRIRSTGSDPFFCCWYWVRDDPAAEGRILIGSGGVASRPSVADAVMIGYSVLPGYQNRGFATEAVRHIAREVFLVPSVRAIFASTCPGLAGSVRVLEKNGFSCLKKTVSGTGFEEGTLLYALDRPRAWPAAHGRDPAP